MSRPDRIHTLTAMVPCNDLDTGEAFYNRLGFWQDPDAEPDTGTYRMLADADGAEIHLTDAVEGWVVPGRNPFALYLYTRDVDAFAARRPRPRHRAEPCTRAQRVGNVRVQPVGS